MMSAAWTYLILAGVFEIGWPVGLKMAQTPGKVLIGVLVAAACISLSGWLLWMAQRAIPIGTAYAVWTGIGAAGTFLIGIVIYGDPPALLRFLALGLIISGVILLKLAH
jgi:quaternary ammonium compound-resistance protein SugE